jgi:hypothetical protein
MVSNLSVQICESTPSRCEAFISGLNVDPRQRSDRSIHCHLLTVLDTPETGSYPPLFRGNRHCKLSFAELTAVNSLISAEKLVFFSSI